MFFKLKSWAAEDTIEKWKDATEWEKIFSSHIQTYLILLGFALLCIMLCFLYNWRLVATLLLSDNG